jgi:N-acetylglucosaminyldiphosphoundecaprenol N-acetyl-beta-D-mannosaminyltransferase
VLGVGVHAINMAEAVEVLLTAARERHRGYVCVTGVHGVIESQSDPELRRIHNASLLTVPDGIPTVWTGHNQGFVRMGRVYGPDLMLALCRKSVFTAEATAESDGHGEAGTAGVNAKTQGKAGRRSEALITTEHAELHGKQPSAIPASQLQPLRHFFYGATPDVLTRLVTNLQRQIPGLQVAGTYAPPFRPLTAEEEQDLIACVAAARPDFFWVGLSTPKQEQFMARMTGQLDATIMVGVGAAFDILAGVKKDAPEWMKRAGFQWLFRLCQEPRRLWRRYLFIVPYFLWLSLLQMIGWRKYRLPRNESATLGLR